MVGHGPSAPAVRVSIGEESLVPGDRGRVSVRTRADGYVVVLHADPAGHVRVLYPLDPEGATQRVRGDSDLVVRSRGGGRDAFTAGSTLGDGTVLAAYSTSRPFRGTLYAHSGHWDPLALPRVAPGGDAEGVLLALAGNMLPRDARFDYDVAAYRVSEAQTVAATTDAGYDADAIPVGANGYDGAAAAASGGGVAMGYDDWSYGSYSSYGGYYGGLFPVVLVLPASYYGRGYARGGFCDGFDPYYLAVGCSPLAFGSYPGTIYYGRGGPVVYRGGSHARRPGRGGSPYSYKRRPASTPIGAPIGYRPRDGATSGTPLGAAPVVSPRSLSERRHLLGDPGSRRLIVGPPPTAAPAAQPQQSPPPQRVYTPRTWTPMTSPATTAPPQQQRQPPPPQQQQPPQRSGPTLWRTPATRAAPAPAPPPPQQQPQRAAPGGARVRSR
jgi:hypothetical protein